MQRVMFFEGAFYFSVFGKLSFNTAATDTLISVFIYLKVVSLKGVFLFRCINWANVQKPKKKLPVQSNYFVGTLALQLLNKQYEVGGLISEGIFTLVPSSKMCQFAIKFST